MSVQCAPPPPHGRAELRVPQLREDLEILEGWPSHNGAPTWLLFDPLRNRYFRINNSMFQMLAFWESDEFSKITERAAAALHRPVEGGELGEFVKFLFANELTAKPLDGEATSYARIEAQKHKSLFGRALHGYLFFKVPLFRPQRFLRATWPIVKPLFSSAAATAFIIFGLLSLYLVSQQWSAFTSQFMHFLSIEGIALFAVSLVFVKIVHELGHAYMATKYGLDVPVIGVAFLVLMPIMYTDTSNAWRLPSRRKRLMVDGAGIMTEMCLAVIATLFWVFLPDGTMRAIAFSIATAGWILSVVINLNPFMRFDGYYILSDVLGFENLQERGFKMARWKLREVLFALCEPPPERLSRRLAATLVLHAWGTWIYRFFLFLGIAFLVYAFFIKVIGIFLFVVEIAWFILLPIYREMKVWWSMRSRLFQTRRGWTTLSVWVGLAIAFFAPLSNEVRFPAVLHASQEVEVVPPLSAKLVSLKVAQGDRVAAGQTLTQMQSQTLALDIERVESEIELLKTRIDRSGSNTQEKNQTRILQSQLVSKQQTLSGLLQRSDELVIKAAFSGVVVDMDRSLRSGDMVARGHLMFRIKTDAEVSVSGLVAEHQVPRLTLQAKGAFIPENLALEKIPLILNQISETPIQQIAFVELADIYGGTVPIMDQSGEKPAPMGSYYRAKLAASDDQSIAVEQTQIGTVHLQAKAVSLSQRVFRRIGSVLIRESGF
ncbi:biotin/lipoyl-binding protein [Pseudahrensia aquimaris]|uniref:Biotin/lipoyl-binding protein n=1 Tax=Pseudahrensia aquimaris TaxID=744461 RepID=A0ABW3FDN4_9HYPH